MKALRRGRSRQRSIIVVIKCHSIDKTMKTKVLQTCSRKILDDYIYY